jgi:hypothetical protein
MLTLPKGKDGKNTEQNPQRKNLWKFEPYTEQK